MNQILQKQSHERILEQIVFFSVIFKKYNTTFIQLKIMHTKFNIYLKSFSDDL